MSHAPPPAPVQGGGGGGSMLGALGATVAQGKWQCDWASDLVYSLDMHSPVGNESDPEFDTISPLSL